MNTDEVVIVYSEADKPFQILRPGDLSDWRRLCKRLIARKTELRTIDVLFANFDKLMSEFPDAYEGNGGAVREILWRWKTGESTAELDAP